MTARAASRHKKANPWGSEAALDQRADPSRPEKARHVQNLAGSGRFHAVREVFLHARQVAPAGEIAQLPRVFGPVARRLDEGAAEHDVGLDRFEEAVRRRLNPDANTLWWSYRVRLAVK